MEFKREAFKLYEELRGFIRHQVASTIFRVNVQVSAGAAAADRDADATPEQLASALRTAGPAGAAPPAAGPDAAAGATATSTGAAAVLGGSVTASSAAGATAEMHPPGQAGCRCARCVSSTATRRSASAPPPVVDPAEPAGCAQDRAQRPLLLRLGHEVQGCHAS